MRSSSFRRRVTGSIARPAQIAAQNSSAEKVSPVAGSRSGQVGVAAAAHELGQGSQLGPGEVAPILLQGLGEQALITAWIGDNECQVNATASSADNATRPDFNTVGDGSEGVKCEVDEARVTLIWAWIVAIFCVGGMIGGSACGIVSSRLGR